MPLPKFTKPIIPPGHVRIQPNAVFQDEAEMRDWLKNNIPSAVILKTWRVEMLACEVSCPEPKAPILEKKKAKR